MIDSISIARSGLMGFGASLRAIANNTANLNTPGFKGSSTQFANMFYGSHSLTGNGNGNSGQFGYGLNTLGTTMNFQQGEMESTGNDLDLALDGQGFFVLKDTNGNIHYTQDGQFKFDSSGTLVSTTTGERVMTLGSDGNLTPVSLTNLKSNPAKATSTITFSGNLSSTTTSDTVGNVTVMDSAGTSHTLSLSFAPVANASGSWTATLSDGATTVGTATLVFAGGRPTAASARMSMTYLPSGGTAIPLTLDFSSNVTSFDGGASSTLVVASQDGYGAGTFTKATFDASGTLVLTYSNGQTVKNRQLAIGQYVSEDDVEAVGNNEFSAKDGAGWQIGIAGSGQFGSVQSGHVEMSNVDLSQEFSELVIMQRGYQACSQVISTSSDMLTTLFGMMAK